MRFGQLRIDEDWEKQALEEEIVGIEVKSTLQLMAHNYDMDNNYVRNVETDYSTADTVVVPIGGEPSRRSTATHDQHVRSTNSHDHRRSTATHDPHIRSTTTQDQRRSGATDRRSGATDRRSGGTDRRSTNTRKSKSSHTDNTLVGVEGGSDQQSIPLRVFRSESLSRRPTPPSRTLMARNPSVVAMAPVNIKDKKKKKKTRREKVVPYLQEEKKAPISSSSSSSSDSSSDTTENSEQS
jgi:hypothetical protein